MTSKGVKSAVARPLRSVPVFRFLASSAGQACFLIFSSVDLACSVSSAGVSSIGLVHFVDHKTNRRSSPMMAITSFSPWSMPSCL